MDNVRIIIGKKEHLVKRDTFHTILLGARYGLTVAGGTNRTAFEQINNILRAHKSWAKEAA